MMIREDGSCSTKGCHGFAVAPGGQCHDCLEEGHEPYSARCRRCGTEVIEFTMPYCPGCEGDGDFPDPFDTTDTQQN